MERDQVIQVGRLRGIEKFEGEIENFIYNTFLRFKPVKRFENRSSGSKFRSFNNGTSKGVLDLLKTIYLRREDWSKECYSSQVWNVRWRLQLAMILAVLESR